MSPSHNLHHHAIIEGMIARDHCELTVWTLTFVMINQSAGGHEIDEYGGTSSGCPMSSSLVL